MLEKVFQFQKDLCDSTYTIASSVQENYESVLKNTLDYYPWLPDQGKKVCLFWSEQCWLGLDNLKKASLSNLDYIEKMVTPPTLKQKTTKAAKQAAQTAKPAAVKAKSTTKNRRPQPQKRLVLKPVQQQVVLQKPTLWRKRLQRRMPRVLPPSRVQLKWLLNLQPFRLRKKTAVLLQKLQKSPVLQRQKKSKNLILQRAAAQL